MAKRITRENYSHKQWEKDVAYLEMAKQSGEKLEIVDFPHNVDIDIPEHRDYAIFVVREMVYSYYPKINSTGGGKLHVDLTTNQQMLRVAENIYDCAKRRVREFGEPQTDKSDKSEKQIQSKTLEKISQPDFFGKFDSRSAASEDYIDRSRRKHKR